MLVKINVSDKEMQLVINSLAEMGKPISKKVKARVAIVIKTVSET